MIVISGTLKIASEDRVKAIGLVEPLVTASLAEEGCDAYGFWEDPSRPGLIRVFEEWKDDAALAQHFGTPHMAVFMEALGNLKVESMELFRYDVSGKKPLFG